MLAIWIVGVVTAVTTAGVATCCAGASIVDCWLSTVNWNDAPEPVAVTVTVEFCTPGPVVKPACTRPWALLTSTGLVTVPPPDTTAHVTATPGTALPMLSSSRATSGCGNGVLGGATWLLLPPTGTT